MKALLVAGLTLVATLTPLGAVEFGQPDGEGHPAVCLLIFDWDPDGEDGPQPVQPAWRCTGTLIAPDVVLTAGHCTDGAVGARAYFQSDVEPLVGVEYPFPGPNSIEGTPVPHPDFAWVLPNTHDVGVVILNELDDQGAPVLPNVDPPQYGKLPDSAGMLDPLATRRGPDRTLFTVVGYGLQSVVPQEVDTRTRYAGEVMLVTLRSALTDGHNVQYSSNPGSGTGQGGTCFGDSGGPLFLGDSLTVAGVISFGFNSNCVGANVAYRVDQGDILEWVRSFLPEP
jgi:hypothetical protein